MKKLIETIKDLYWVSQGKDNTVEIYLSDEVPDISLCTASYAVVFKDGQLLQTELKESERQERRLDIPGGHIDSGENPEQVAIRETYEETGVVVKNPRLIGYMKITENTPRVQVSQYSYPTGYMTYYLCDVGREDDFKESDECYGRVWLPVDEFEKSVWCRENRVLIEEVIKIYFTQKS